MTKQRRLIYEIVLGYGDHIPADEILKLAREKSPGISRATVFNCLNYLTDRGLIRRVHIKDMPMLYDKTLSEHEHLVCSRCGRISDIAIKGLFGALREKSGIDIIDFELNLYYVCPECKNEENNKYGEE